MVANSILDGNEILFASSDLVREGDINCEVLLLRKELPSVFSDICMWSIIIIFKPSNNIKNIISYQVLLLRLHVLQRQSHSQHSHLKPLNIMNKEDIYCIPKYC